MRQGKTNNRTSLTIALILVTATGFHGATSVAQERFRVAVNDIVVDSGGQGVLEVTFANPMDEVAWILGSLRLSECDLATFVEEPGGIFGEIQVDTVGTLFSGCGEFYASASPTDESITSMVFDAFPGLSPQAGGVLFRLPVHMNSSLPDDGSYRADVHIDIEVYGWWQSDLFPLFPRTEGTTVDTAYYMCRYFEPPPGAGCYTWEKVMSPCDCPGGECDRIEIYTNNWAIDETQTTIEHGSITMRTLTCGDVNGDDDVTIADVSIIIDHLFIDNPPIDPIEPGNVNCSDEQPVVLTIGDVSTLIDHLFISEEPLCCDE